MPLILQMKEREAALTQKVAQADAQLKAAAASQVGGVLPDFSIDLLCSFFRVNICVSLPLPSPGPNCSPVVKFTSYILLLLYSGAARQAGARAACLSRGSGKGAQQTGCNAEGAAGQTH